MAFLPFFINYIMDPYDVFKHRTLKEYGQLQERFLKIEYLSKNKLFDTFLLGSSRLGTTPTEYVANLYHNIPYNLAVSQANQWDNLEMTKWLLANQPRTKHLIMMVS